MIAGDIAVSTVAVKSRGLWMELDVWDRLDTRWRGNERYILRGQHCISLSVSFGTRNEQGRNVYSQNRVWWIEKIIFWRKKTMSGFAEQETVEMAIEKATYVNTQLL